MTKQWEHVENHIHCLKISENFGKLPRLVNEAAVATFRKQYLQVTEKAVTARLKNIYSLKSSNCIWQPSPLFSKAVTTFEKYICCLLKVLKHICKNIHCWNRVLLRTFKNKIPWHFHLISWHSINFSHLGKLELRLVKGWGKEKRSIN